jgi:hydroxypyruvate reductase
MEDLKQIARGIFVQALADCSIQRALDRVLRIENGAQLIVNSEALIVDGEAPVALDRLRRVRIVAAGKAAASMLEALLARLPLPRACDLAGVLIAPVLPQTLPPSIQFFPGGHPSPNQASFAGASAALSMLRAIKISPPDDTLCLFLISGGASSMMELPLDASISLADTAAFYQALVLSGASIVEINCVRKHFSAIKGGRLALAAGSARKLTLAVSDVPPAHLDALASGPTLPDPTTVADCRAILTRYALLDSLPASVRRFFESPALPETPKPGELISPVITLLDSGELAAAAQQQAAALGFHTVIDNTCDDWPYHRAAGYLLDRLRALRRSHPRCCLISTGEVSVPVPHFKKPAPHLNDSASHLGGRNQHLALYLTTQLRPGDGSVAILSAGSDGIDGNSAAAGAVIDEHTINDHTLDGHTNDQTSPISDRDSALRALAAFDSSTWLAAADATIVTGPTGQNLRDLHILLADSAH